MDDFGRSVDLNNAQGNVTVGVRREASYWATGANTLTIHAVNAETGARLQDNSNRDLRISVPVKVLSPDVKFSGPSEVRGRQGAPIVSDPFTWESEDPNLQLDTYIGSYFAGLTLNKETNRLEGVVTNHGTNAGSWTLRGPNGEQLTKPDGGYYLVETTVIIDPAPKLQEPTKPLLYGTELPGILLFTDLYDDDVVTLDGLPEGLSWDAENKQIVGAPTAAPGTYSVKYSVHDAEGKIVYQADGKQHEGTFEVTIEAPPVQTQSVTRNANTAFTDATVAITNLDQLPQVESVEWVDESLQSAVGTHQTEIRITFVGGSQVVAPVTLVVNEPSSALYDPEIVPQQVRVGEEPSAEDSIGNIIEFPEGTTFEFSEPVDTSKVGPTTGRIKITFPDGESMGVSVAIDVVNDAVLYPAFAAEQVVDLGVAPSAEKSIANSTDLPQGTLFEFETPVDVRTDGLKDAVVLVTYQDGSIAKVPVRVNVLPAPVVPEVKNSDEFEPIKRDQSTLIREELTAESFITNVSELPKGTKFEFNGKPDFAIVGPNEAEVVVIYPDNSFETATVNYEVKALPVEEARWNNLRVKAGESAFVANTVVEGRLRLISVEKQGETVGSDWIQVLRDGRVVAAPTEDHEAGDYVAKVERTNEFDEVVGRYTFGIAVDDAGETSAKWVPSYLDSVITAGEDSASFAPIFENSAIKDDVRTAPAGTKFALANPSSLPDGFEANIDAQGIVTLSAPRDLAKDTEVMVEVVITYADGSSSTASAKFTVIAPPMNSTYEIKYEAGKATRAGERAVIEMVTKDLPRGVQFSLRNRGQNYGGWTFTVNPTTGQLIATAPKEKAEPATVSVTAVFPDGTSQITPVSIGVDATQALASTSPAQYKQVASYVGENAEAKQQATVPTGTTFRLLERGDLPLQWGKVTVSSATGDVKISVPEDATVGDIFTLYVLAEYPDGSQARVPVSFVIAAREQAKPGEPTKGSLNWDQPDVKFSVDTKTVPKDWTVMVDPDTGDYTITVPENTAPTSQIIKVNVAVPTIKDPSKSEVKQAVIRIDVPRTGSPTTPTPKPLQEPENSSESLSSATNIVALVLAAIGLIGGVVLAALGVGNFLPPSVKAQLRSMGFPIR